MYTSTRKFFAAMAITGAMVAPLAACSSSNDSSNSASSGQGLVQIAGEDGQYSAEQDQEWRDATGHDPNEPSSNTHEAIISAATEKTFDVPGDIDPGTYIFEPYQDKGGVFYANPKFQQLPDVHLINETTVVTIPSGTLVLERMQVFAATDENISTLPHVDLSTE